MTPGILPCVKFSAPNEFDDDAVLVELAELLIDAAESGRCFDDGEPFSLPSLDATKRLSAESFGDCVGESLLVCVVSTVGFVDRSVAREYESLGDAVGLKSLRFTLSSDLVTFKFVFTASWHTTASSSLSES